MSSESKMGIKYWLLLPHFSHYASHYELILGYFVNKLNSGLEANCEKGGNGFAGLLWFSLCVSASEDREGAGWYE